MYVNRLRLHNVKSLHRDIPEGGGPLPEPARRRLLLQGANGSGKTTILDCIRLLWERFGQWIDGGQRRVEVMNGRQPERLASTEFSLDEAELAALELGDFPTAGKTLWIGVGRAHAWEELKRQYPEAEFAGLIRSDTAPGTARLELPPGDWKTFRQRSMVGSEPQVNIVSFPPDNRSVAPPPEMGPRLIDTTQLNWSAVCDPRFDLDSVLLTVKALRPEGFDETVHLVNLALGRSKKRLVGFGDDGRLTVEGQTDDGATYCHAPESLSSGERQYLLLVTYTVGFLRPGGIVLIDEPALDIDWTLLHLLMESLDIVLRQRGGQLIVASHSERVAEWFGRDSEKLDLTPWSGGKR